MAEAEEELPTVGRRRRWPAVLVVAAGLIALAILAAWLARERIAGSVISGQLETYGLPATYRIESAGPRRQVLRDIVVGDPAHPDLTIERVETELVPRFGAPAIGAVTLVRPRLYGVYRAGKLSFGTLDKALFGAWQAGTLCLNISADNVSLLTSGLVQNVLPGLTAVTHGKEVPMLLALRPTVDSRRLLGGAAAGEVAIEEGPVDVGGHVWKSR